MTDMPDFDSMSPEEMMKWMESLAKRQGATEGLTTSADMDVAEVAADDERLAGKGDYVPYGWTEDKWKEHLAKEEAEKKAKQAASPPPQPVQAAPPPPQPEPEPEPVAPAASADAMPDFDSMSPEEMMKWMESLAKRQGATEGLTTSADMQVAEVSADDERLAGKGDYVPYGWTEDKWKEHLAKEEAQKKAKQAEQPPAQPVQAAPPQPEPEPEPEDDEDLETALAGNVLEAPSLDDLFGGNNVIEEEEPEEEPAFDMPSFDDLFAGEAENEIPDLDLSALEGLGETANAADDPLAWLAGLSGGEEESVPDIDLDALSGLSDLGAAEPVAESNPMDWLAGLADDSDMLDEAEGDTEEGSLEWLESLARREGADSEELVTNADFDIPMPDNFLDDGPGYEDFSFEQGSGIIADDEDEELVPSFDLDAMDMDDPENWLDQLAQSQSGTSSVGFGDDEDDEEIGEDIPHFDDVKDDIQAKINSGNVSPEEIALLFGTAFDAAKKRDVPDYIDSEDDEDLELVEAPVQAEIPDWLQETMNTVSEEDATDIPSPRKGDTAEMMLQNLGLEEEAVEELPDWLSADIGEDTGDITVDIFDVPAEETPPTRKTSEIGTEEVAVIDTSDSWVQAFQQEASGELEEWYEGRIAEIEGGAVAQPIPEPVAQAQPEPIAAVSAEGLQVANLPLETTLEHGEAMLVPVWLGGEEVAATDLGSVEAAAVGEMDWLSDDATDAVDVDMPDWLKEQVDDTVAPAEELPAWLAGDDIDIESVEEIPDWLRETMGEEEEALVADVDFTIEEEEPALPAPAPEPTLSAPKPAPTAITSAPKSPAPVPKVAAAIDVSAAFNSAEQKVSAGDIDGAMLDYESIVRSNQALEQVEKALDKLAKADVTKRNPAVFRVLGDVRMRQGKLQEALDTYRRALNML